MCPVTGVASKFRLMFAKLHHLAVNVLEQGSMLRFFTCQWLYQIPFFPVPHFPHLQMGGDTNLLGEAL